MFWDSNNAFLGAVALIFMCAERDAASLNPLEFKVQAVYIDAVTSGAWAAHELFVLAQNNISPA